MLKRGWVLVSGMDTRDLWMNLLYDTDIGEPLVQLPGNNGSVRLVPTLIPRDIPITPPWAVEKRLGDESFQQGEQGHGFHGWWESGKEDKPAPDATAGGSGETPEPPPVDPTDTTWSVSGEAMSPASWEQALTQKPDGGSVKPGDGSQPQTGFSVAGVQEQLPYSPDPAVMAQTIFDHVQANKDLYSRSDMYVGWWLQRDNVTNEPVAFVVEPSQKVENPATAAYLGVTRNQDSIWNNAQGVANELAKETGFFADGKPYVEKNAPNASIPCYGNGKFGVPNENYAPNCTAFGDLTPGYISKSDPNGPFVTVTGSSTAALDLPQDIQDKVQDNLAKIPGMENTANMSANATAAAQGFTCAQVAFGLTAFPRYHNEAQRQSDATQNNQYPISPVQVAGMIAATCARTNLAVNMGASDFISQAVSKDSPVVLPLDILYATNELTGGATGVTGCNIQNGVALSQQPNLISASQGLMKMMVQAQMPAPTEFGAKKNGDPLTVTPSFYQNGMDKAIQIGMGHEFENPSVPVDNTILGKASGSMKEPNFANNIIAPNNDAFATMDTLMVEVQSGGQSSAFGKVNDSPSITAQGQTEWKGGSYSAMVDANATAAAAFSAQVGFHVSNIEFQAMGWGHQEDSKGQASGAGSQGGNRIDPTVAQFNPVAPQGRDVTTTKEATQILMQGPKDSALGAITPSSLAKSSMEYGAKFTDNVAKNCKADVATRLAEHTKSDGMSLINAATPPGFYPADVFDAQLLEAPTLSIYREPELKQAACSELISGWAGTSNDSSPQSLAMQEAAKAEFGLQNTAEWGTTVSPVPANPLTTDAVAAAAKIMDSHGAVLQDFVRAQYNDTQQMLKDQGVASVTLYRGQGTTHGEATEWKTVDLGTQEAKQTEAQMRPISSWTTSYSVALGFSHPTQHDPVLMGGEVLNAGVILTAQVPANQILSTPRTGFGCLNEHEFTVLGNVKNVTVTKDI